MLIINERTAAALYQRGLSASIATKIVGYLEFERATRISHSSLLRQVSIGSFSYVMEGADLHNCSIGRYCSIAANVSCVREEHPVDWLTSSPVLYNTMFGGGQNDPPPYHFHKEDRVKIGHDVLIGRNVTILRGINIGTGAIIGANSVVTKDIDTYSIVAGAPARHIRYRFDKAMLDILRSIEWYNFDLMKWNKQGGMPDLRSLTVGSLKYIKNLIESGAVPALRSDLYRLDDIGEGNGSLSVLENKN